MTKNQVQIEGNQCGSSYLNKGFAKYLSSSQSKFKYSPKFIYYNVMCDMYILTYLSIQKTLENIFVLLGTLAWGCEGRNPPITDKNPPRMQKAGELLYVDRLLSRKTKKELDYSTCIILLRRQNNSHFSSLLLCTFVM